MREKDKVAIINEKHWERMVREECGYTRPWLDLDADLIRQYASGALDPVPESLAVISPGNILADVAGKDVLCLAAGGGQQSAVFGLLGGVFRIDFGQPAVHFMTWDGDAYRVSQSYCEKLDRRADGAIEFRHYMDDIFNGLVDTGMSIRQVMDLSRYAKPDPQALPGSWAHEAPYIGDHFVIVAKNTEVYR